MEAALFESITDLASGLGKKEFSSRELTLAYLDRLRRFGPRYNALAHLFEEPALRQADQADTLFSGWSHRKPPARYSLQREGPSRDKGYTHLVGRRAISPPAI